MLPPRLRSPISFGDAQSSVVSQPGSPHHQAIKSAGKNPGETSPLRHNSKKGAAGTGGGRRLRVYFCSDVSWRRRSRPRVLSWDHQLQVAKQGVQGRLLHQAGFSWCSKCLGPGVGSVLGPVLGSVLPQPCWVPVGAVTAWRDWGVGECERHSRA